MRQLIEQTIADNWARGYDEGLPYACYLMGWEYKQNADQTGYSIGGHVVKLCVADDGLRKLLEQLSDAALLEFVRWQHCQEFR